MAQVLTSSVISAVKKNTFVDYDSPLLDWYKPFFFPAAAQGMWVVRILPLDDKIPIRNLFLPDRKTLRGELKQTWEGVWEKLGERRLAGLVQDFMDDDDKASVGGAERETHINRYPVDISEFLILEEMTPKLLYGGEERLGLADYCTLWSDGKININFAPVQVIEVLPGMNRFLAEKVVEHRNVTALKRASDLRSIPSFPPRAMGTLMNLVAFRSQYFNLQIELLEDTGGGTSFSIIFDRSGRIVRWEEI